MVAERSDNRSTLHPATLAALESVERVAGERLIPDFLSFGSREGPIDAGLLATDPLSAVIAFGVDVGATVPTVLEESPVTPRDTPGESGERLRWADIARAIPITVTAEPLAWEIMRFDVPTGALAVLERLACYLRVTADGVPPFVTAGPVDPFVALVDGVGEPLRFAWHLRITTGVTADPGFLTGAPVSSIVGDVVDGFPSRWTDLRFAWGSAYTEHRQAVIQGPARVRFWFEVQSSGAFTVTAGGLLGYYVQNAGQSGAALRTATSRAGS